MLKLSVVIPCRDDAEFLSRCLAALAGQSVQPDEIIVVDNDSIDRSATLAKRSGAKVVSQKIPGIGPTAAAGYEAAAGDIIARLDADSVPRSDWVAKILAAFEADPELDFLAGGGEFYGKGRFANWCGDHLYLGGMWTFVTPYLGHPPVFGSNFAMRKQAWQEVRDYAHTQNSTIHDDLDLSFAIRPWHKIVRDKNNLVGVSNRPFDTWSGLGRRIWWVATTMQANGSEAVPLSHRRYRTNYLQRQEEVRRHQNRGSTPQDEER